MICFPFCVQIKWWLLPVSKACESKKVVTGSYGKIEVLIACLSN